MAARNTTPALVWLRQDLRLADQAAFAAAAGEGPVVALYVLDDASPGEWSIGGAQRWWLHHSLAALGQTLEAIGIPLVLRRGRAVEQASAVAREIGAVRVHALRHYEPWWKEAEAALAGEAELVLHDGGQLAPPHCVKTGTGGRFQVFTPYWRALQKLMPPAPPEPVAPIEGFRGEMASDRLSDWHLLPTKPDWSKGFDIWTPGEAGARAALDAFAGRLAAYHEDRNFPSKPGSSRLSAHLHFGEISPATVWHTCADAAGNEAEPFLRELGWRDFTANMIDTIPDYGARHARATFDRLAWRTGADADADFAAWSRGRTGYPLVDAGMRELWATGWMHNRVRMVAASFLVKHLLIDWRRGQDWYWDTLIDADYGNNAVNWQWIAGTGTDANQFGRIMAPLIQSAKFDAADYIRQWVPELAGLSDETIHDPEESGVLPKSYPRKLIGHREGRERALAAAKAARA